MTDIWITLTQSDEKKTFWQNQSRGKTLLDPNFYRKRRLQEFKDADLTGEKQYTAKCNYLPQIKPPKLTRKGKVIRPRWFGVIWHKHFIDLYVYCLCMSKYNIELCIVCWFKKTPMSSKCLTYLKDNYSMKKTTYFRLGVWLVSHHALRLFRKNGVWRWGCFGDRGPRRKKTRSCFLWFHQDN